MRNSQNSNGAINKMNVQLNAGTAASRSEPITDFISYGRNSIPLLLLDERRVPPFYREAIACCGAPNPSQLPNTGLVYNLMVASGLPRQVLGDIWSMVNCTFPGQLTREEFYACLSLIAVAQEGVCNYELGSATILPIPKLCMDSLFAQSSKIAGCPTQAQRVERMPSQSTSSQSATVSIGRNSLRAAIGTIPIINSRAEERHINDSSMHAASGRIPLSVGSVNIPVDHASIRHTSIFHEAVNKLQQYEKFSLQKADCGQVSNPQISLLSVGDPSSFSSAPSVTVNTPDDNADNVDQGPNSSWLLDLEDSYQEKVNHHDNEETNSLRNVKTESDSSSLERKRTALKKLECLTVWKRCIYEALNIFQSANIFLPPFSHECLSAISSTQRGSNYLMALQAIYEMVMRIRDGREDELSESIKQLEEISSIWSRLAQFCTGNTDRYDCNLDCDPSKFCAICLKSIIDHSLLEFCGSNYHKQCANFWINRVRSLLPKLNSC